MASSEEARKRKAEYTREWSKKNPEKVKEHSRRTRIKNKDKIRDRQRAWREKNKEHVQQYGRDRYLRDKEHLKDLQLQRIFGITLEEYRRMLEEQGGVCAVCRSDQPKDAMGRGEYFSVDHCHTTGKVRGLLCGGCNVGMGHLKDDPVILQAALEYLKTNS